VSTAFIVAGFYWKSYSNCFLRRAAACPHKEGIAAALILEGHSKPSSGQAVPLRGKSS